MKCSMFKCSTISSDTIKILTFSIRFVRNTWLNVFKRSKETRSTKGKRRKNWRTGEQRSSISNSFDPIHARIIHKGKKGLRNRNHNNPVRFPNLSNASAHKLPRVSEISPRLVLFNARAERIIQAWRRWGPCIRLGHRNYSSRARENRVGTQLYVARRPNANFAFVDPAARIVVYEKNVSRRKSVVHESSCLSAIKKDSSAS